MDPMLIVLLKLILSKIRNPELGASPPKKQALE